MKRLAQVLMVAMLFAAGFGLVACTNADFAGVPENDGIQVPSTGLNGDEDQTTVENSDDSDATNVAVDTADDDGDDADQDASGADDPLKIDTDSLADGTTGIAYREDLKGIGGSRSYRWSIASGKLPDGLQLCERDGSNCGASVIGRYASISGMPTVSGNFNFAIRIVDDEEPSLSAEKGFSIKIELKTVDVVLPTQSGPTDVTVVPNAAMSIQVAAAGKSILMQQIINMGPIPMPQTGMLAEPLVLSVTVNGGQAPYTWKVVAQGDGEVVPRDGGGFQLVLTKAYPLLTDPDLDPEVPVTVLVKDAKGVKAQTTVNIPVRIPMQKVTDLSITWCLDEERCETEVNNELLLFVQDNLTIAAHCYVNDNHVQMDSACFDEGTWTEFGYPEWAPLNSNLDQVDEILYGRFLDITSYSLSIHSYYWQAQLLYAGHDVSGFNDIIPMIKDSNDGHLWRRRGVAFVGFRTLALEKQASMSDEIANF